MGNTWSKMLHNLKLFLFLCHIPVCVNCFEYQISVLTKVILKPSTASNILCLSHSFSPLLYLHLSLSLSLSPPFSPSLSPPLSLSLALSLSLSLALSAFCKLRLMHVCLLPCCMSLTSYLHIY